MTGQYHTIDLHVTKLQSPPKAYIPLCILSPQLSLVPLYRQVPTGIPHTITGTICPETDHARATPKTIPLITVSLAPGTTDRLHTRKTLKLYSQTETPHRPQHHKKVTIEDLQLDSSSELDENWDALNY